MTHVPSGSKAWPKAGADPQPVASGEQIDTDQDLLGTDAAGIDGSSKDGEKKRLQKEADRLGVEDRKSGAASQG